MHTVPNKVMDATELATSSSRPLMTEFTAAIAEAPQTEVPAAISMVSFLGSSQKSVKTLTLARADEL